MMSLLEKIDIFLNEERIEIEFTTEKEEKWVKKLAQKWQRKAGWSFFTDAVIVDAKPDIIAKIRMEVSDATKKLKGLYVSEYAREGTVNEATVEFYTNAQSRPSDELQIKDVPDLLRSVGMAGKKTQGRHISIESEGDRKALNKALKAGKRIYAAYNPFLQDIGGVYQILWHTNKKKFVELWKGLVGEI